MNGTAMADDSRAGAATRRHRRDLVCSHASRDEAIDVTMGDRHGGVIVAEVAGEIDLWTAQTLRNQLVKLSAAGSGHVVADFSLVRFCDATGLGALVAVRNQLRRQGADLHLARVRPAQRRILQITGLDRLFVLHDDVRDAVRAARRGTAAQSE